MSDTNTERVVMVWPKELKDQVRAVAGTRGITEFVMKAVRHRLSETPPPPPPEPDPEIRQPSEPAVLKPVSAKSPEEARQHKQYKPATYATGPNPDPQPEPESDREAVPDLDLPHDLGGRDDLFARLMEKTGGNAEFETLKTLLKPASGIPKPKEGDELVVAGRCSACGEELIDGECWTCG